MIRRWIVDKENGFTLVEVTVAMFIMTVCGLAALGACTQAIGTTRVIKQHTVAMNLARQTVESLKMNEAQGADWTGVISAAGGCRTINNVAYTITVAPSDFPENTPQVVKDHVVPVQVKVTFPAAGVPVSYVSYFEK